MSMRLAAVVVAALHVQVAALPGHVQAPHRLSPEREEASTVTRVTVGQVHARAVAAEPAQVAGQSVTAPAIDTALLSTGATPIIYSTNCWWVLCGVPGTSGSHTARWVVPLSIGISFALFAALLAVMQRGRGGGQVDAPAAEVLIKDELKESEEGGGGGFGCCRSQVGEVGPAPVEAPAGEKAGAGAGAGKARVYWYDNAKMLGIIMVAVDHGIHFGNQRLRENGVELRGMIGETIGAILAMPIFFFVAGAVSSAEINTKTIVRTAVMLLLPPLFAYFLKELFLDTSMLDWRVGAPWTNGALLVGGFIDSGISEGDYWFLPTLFLLRCVYLPFVGNVDTIWLVLFTAVGYLQFVLTTNDDVDTPHKVITRAMIYLPWIMMGFLCKRHSIVGKFLKFSKENFYGLLAVRAVAAGALVTFLVLDTDGKSATIRAGVSVTGCGLGPGGDISTLPQFPDPQRFHQLGCLLKFQLIRLVNVLSWLVVVPYSRLPFFSQAGTRTLTGYVLMQVQWVLTPLLIRLIAVWGNWSGQAFPKQFGQFLFMFLPASLVSVICSDSFHFAVAPFVAPTWTMRILYPKEPSRSDWKFTWLWLCVFLGGAFVMNGLVSV